MNASIPLENQLLVTKFYVPVTSSSLISRSRLTALLDESLKYPLTLISATAGFGKTSLLASWSQSLETHNPRVAWISLDEEDNEPRLFWMYVLAALSRQQPERFSPLLTQVQSLQLPPLNYLLAEIINLLAEGTDCFLLILDDYHVITEQQVHTTLAYLIEHLPPQLHIILSTRIDPPLPLWQLRACGQVLEIRTGQLRCVVEETKAFFNEVMGIQLSDETAQEITARTEGWLVALQLLALSLPVQTNPATLLQEVSGDQRYILDYLTEEVLRQQPQDVQTFLLSTCILERLNASLCDAVVEQGASQQMLQRLERANLFVVSLDSKREWYRYHALFAEALHSQLERIQGNLVPILHYRASLWYAKHDQAIKAILHALHARQWIWVADLFERNPALLSYTWGAGEHELFQLQEWFEQLPAEVIGSRPRLCLACTQILWAVAPPSRLEVWLSAAKATLTTSLARQTSEDASHSTLESQARLDQENLLGEVIACLAFMQSYLGGGLATLSLCQQAFSLLYAKNFMLRSIVSHAQLEAYHSSALNDTQAAIKSGLQAVSYAQAAGNIFQTIDIMGITALRMIEAGQLHEAQQLIQQAIHLGKQEEKPVLFEVGWPMALQAEILREWNQLDEALALTKEAILLCEQIVSISSLSYPAYGYAALLHISLSRGELDVASSALQEFERLSMKMNQPTSAHLRAFFTTVDHVRLWLANGELDRATRWAEGLASAESHGTPFACEREEVAYVRVLLAKKQPDLALRRLEAVLERITVGKRWGHVIEARLLQALSYQMNQQENQALDVLSEAIRLAEPEGYIRSFVDEGAPMEALLYRLRKRNRKYGPTPYLDTVLGTFQQDSTISIQAAAPTKTQPLPKPLSERELEILRLLTRGLSNQEIAQELVIALDTVKRHISHIFSKLGVSNRVQAVGQAQTLGLLD